MYEEHFLKQDITLNPRLPPQIPEPQGMPQAEFIIATCLRTGGFIGKSLPAHYAVVVALTPPRTLNHLHPEGRREAPGHKNMAMAGASGGGLR